MVKLSALIVPAILVTQFFQIAAIGNLRNRIDLLSLGLRAANCRTEMRETGAPCKDADAIRNEARKYVAPAPPQGG